MPTGVVIPQRLGTPEALQQRVRREYHVLDLLDTAILASRNSGDVLHNLLGGLGLTRAGLARDNDTLVLMIRIHVVVRGFSDREDVRGNFKPILALVLLEDILGVDAQVCTAYNRFAPEHTSKTDKTHL